jgi:hypothetical protein
MPGRLHKHKGAFVVAGLGLPFTTVTPAIFKGKMHFQQISVIGLTNRPTHLAWAGREVKTRKKDKYMNHNEHAPPMLNLIEELGEIDLILFIVLIILAFIIKKSRWINDPPFFFRRFFFSDALLVIAFIIGLFSVFIKWG